MMPSDSIRRVRILIHPDYGLAYQCCACKSNWWEKQIKKWDSDGRPLCVTCGQICKPMPDPLAVPT